MHYINGDGGIKIQRRSFNLLIYSLKKAKYEIVITINAIYERVSIILGSQWLGGREADIAGTVRV